VLLRKFSLSSLGVQAEGAVGEKGGVVFFVSTSADEFTGVRPSSGDLGSTGAPIVVDCGVCKLV